MRKILLLIVLSVSTTNAAQAATSGFCYAVKSSGVYCTAILTVRPSTALACASYARRRGAAESGVIRNTNVAALVLRQEQECNYVEDKPKHQCFIQETCTSSGGASSSISPLDHYVFESVGALDAAKSACVDKAPSEYLNALRSAAAGCLIGAKAVMTIP